MEIYIPELDSSGLRKFGLTMAAAIAVLSVIVLPFFHGRSIHIFAWIVVAVLIAWSLILPASLRPAYYCWMRAALLAGKVNTFFLLSIVFLFVITPVGVVMRLFGYDPLQRKCVRFASSYRKPAITRRPDTMERPY